MFIKEMTTGRPETFYGKEAEKSAFMTPLQRICWTLRSLRCLLFGHKMIRQKWVLKDFDKRKVAHWEWHEGCTRCPKWRTYSKREGETL